MHSRNAEFFLIDIFIAIDNIRQYTKRCKTFKTFAYNKQIFKATIQELGTIGEAMKHVLNYKEFQSFINPDWQLVIDLRNILSHEYFGVDREIIFDVVFHDLDILESELLQLVGKLRDKSTLFHVITRMKQDLKKSHEPESLRYLRSLERRIKNCKT